MKLDIKEMIFCYDNELAVHKVYVDDFEINNDTNGEFEFRVYGIQRLC
jgi:hypothetical protein